MMPKTYIFWVNAGSKETFVRGFRNIGEEVGILKPPLPDTMDRIAEGYQHMTESLHHSTRYDSTHNMLKQVYDWLRDGGNGQWLMILDNADDIYVFRDRKSYSDVLPAMDSGALETFLPQRGSGRILITSRSQQLAQMLALSHDNVRSVAEMDENQAKQLLCKKLVRSETDDKLARELVRAVNYIPLAITHAAGYINMRRPTMTSATYFKEFKEKNSILLSSRVGDARHNPYATNEEVEITTWRITFQRIEKERRSAAELLCLMSFFQP